MPAYQTLQEAVSDMRERGFVYTFTIQQGGIFCPDLDTFVAPEHLMLLERYHVAAPNVVTGEREVYGLRTDDNRMGLMTDAYADYDPEAFTALFARCRQPSPRRA
ncbi:hypothetical protein [Pontibacter liquoris]|uniref:hypothetical protein n=1 Tax=Pontibacter liquoris TaxID=2905677 RepID=UPI001FA7FBAD|nr:hypothetical protein [Pontibacter liquoris]